MRLSLRTLQLLKRLGEDKADPVIDAWFIKAASNKPISAFWLPNVDRFVVWDQPL